MRNSTISRSFGIGALALATLGFAGIAAAQSSSGAASGSGTGNATGSAMTQNQSANGSAMAPGKGGTVSARDSAFMKQAAQNNSMELVASQGALTKATSPDIKTFAQHMIDDHTKAGEELKALASSKGVEVSDKPSIAQSAKIKLLDAMSGASYDKRYAAMVGVSAHQDTVKLFQKASTGSKDADVKAFATKTLPTLQHHLEMAKSLKTASADAKSS